MFSRPIKANRERSWGAKLQVSEEQMKEIAGPPGFVPGYGSASLFNVESNYFK
jgi:hypothetical protein